MESATVRGAINTFITTAAVRRVNPIGPLVPIGSVFTVAMAREAAWSVNVLLLDEFLRGGGFAVESSRPLAFRIQAPAPIVILVRHYKSHRRSNALLFYAEYLGFRLASALIDPEMAIVRGSHVLVQSTFVRAPENWLGTSLWSNSEQGTARGPHNDR